VEGVEQVCEVADAACLSVKATRAKHLLALVCTTTEQYSTVTVQYSTVQYSTVQYSDSAVQYSTVQYSTVQYSTVQYSTVQYSTVQYSTVTVTVTVQGAWSRSTLITSQGVSRTGRAIHHKRNLVRWMVEQLHAAARKHGASAWHGGLSQRCCCLEQQHAK
jgi:hypothetical protein